MPLSFSSSYASLFSRLAIASSRCCGVISRLPKIFASRAAPRRSARDSPVSPWGRGSSGVPIP